MKQIGHRRATTLAEHASGELLAQGARFSEAVARLGTSTFVAKGVYRFRSHDEANRHAVDCLVRGMALLAAQRA